MMNRFARLLQFLGQSAPSALAPVTFKDDDRPFIPQRSQNAHVDAISRLQRVAALQRQVRIARSALEYVATDRRVPPDIFEVVAYALNQISEEMDA